MKIKLHFIVTFLIFFTFIPKSILRLQTLPRTAVMKDIDGGVFKMVGNSLTGNTDQKMAALEHEVTLSIYSMSDTEITNEQYVSFLNAAFVDGRIEIVTGTGGPDFNKRLIQGTASSAYEGKILYSLDGIRVLKDHGNEDGNDSEFTGSIEPENPLKYCVNRI